MSTRQRASRQWSRKSPIQVRRIARDARPHDLHVGAQLLAQHAVGARVDVEEALAALRSRSRDRWARSRCPRPPADPACARAVSRTKRSHAAQVAPRRPAAVPAGLGVAPEVATARAGTGRRSAVARSIGARAGSLRHSRGARGRHPVVGGLVALEGVDEAVHRPARCAPARSSETVDGGVGGAAPATSGSHPPARAARRSTTRPRAPPARSTRCGASRPIWQAGD